MLSLPPSARIYICHQAVDMRKSFDGLAAASSQLLAQSPASGHFFVFLNARRTLIKILNWDGDGYTIWSKRLEQGQFNLPKAVGDRLLLDLRDLHAMLDGVKPGAYYKRFSQPSHNLMVAS